MKQTGVAGIMTAEGNLADPTFFTKRPHRVWEVTDEYMVLVQAERTNFSAVKVRCAFFDMILHSRMPLDPTPARLKRTCV
jgi:hypothetical protein